MRRATMSFDDELYKKAKVKAVMQDITFTEYIENLVKADLEKGEENAE